MHSSKLDSETADQLINRAIQVFSAKGYLATSLQEIAESLFISRGPIYYHFKDKHGLYCAAYDRFEKNIYLIHESIFATDEPLMTQMEELVFQYATHISRHGIYFFYRIDEIEELQEIRERYYGMFQQLNSEKVSMLAAAQKDGRLKSSMPPERVMKYIDLVYFSILEGFNRGYFSSSSKEEIRDLISIHFHGLKKRLLKNED